MPLQGGGRGGLARLRSSSALCAASWAIRPMRAAATASSSSGSSEDAHGEELFDDNLARDWRGDVTNHTKKYTSHTPRLYTCPVMTHVSL